MDRRVIPPTLGPPPLCKQALKVTSHGTIQARRSGCNIVATLFRMVTTLFQHCVALKTVVANRPV